MDNEPLDRQISRLADCILAHYPAEPGRGGSEGAVDVAIRLLVAHCPNARSHDQPTPSCGAPAAPPADLPCPLCGRTGGNHHIGRHVRDLLGPARPDGAS